MNMQRVLENLRLQYADLDRVAKKAISQFKVSCGKGCFACCYQMTALNTLEGLLIADHVCRQENWLETAQKLRDASFAYVKPGLDRAEHFRTRTPCVFLKDGNCSIYEIRPAACRFLYVTTPAELCDPARDSDVGAVNLTELEAHVFKLAEMSLHPIASAPLPLMVLYCMLITALPHQEKMLNQLTNGLPDPITWMNTILPMMKMDVHPETRDAMIDAIKKVGIQ